MSGESKLELTTVELVEQLYALHDTELHKLFSKMMVVKSSPEEELGTT